METDRELSGSVSEPWMRCFLLKAQLTAYEALARHSDSNQAAKDLQELRTKLGIDEPDEGCPTPVSATELSVCHLDTMD